MSPSKIVITGTIASGKTTLSKLLEKLGFVVLSADQVNRELLEKGGINYQAIKDSKVFDQAFDGELLDKQKLARIIFSNEEKLVKLNKLTHKNILNALESRIKQIDQKVVFIEIPLYFQMEEKFSCDEVWLVTSDYETQLKRLMDRDNIDSSYAKEKIESQEELIKMEKQSDIIFDNSLTVDHLMHQLKKVLEKKDLI